jgi:hypothetical protein
MMTSINHRSIPLVQSTALRVGSKMRRTKDEGQRVGVLRRRSSVRSSSVSRTCISPAEPVSHHHEIKITRGSESSRRRPSTVASAGHEIRTASRIDFRHGCSVRGKQPVVPLLLAVLGYSQQSKNTTDLLALSAWYSQSAMHHGLRVWHPLVSQLPAQTISARTMTGGC